MADYTASPDTGCSGGHCFILVGTDGHPRWWGQLPVSHHVRPRLFRWQATRCFRCSSWPGASASGAEPGHSDHSCRKDGPHPGGAGNAARMALPVAAGHGRSVEPRTAEPGGRDPMQRSVVCPSCRPCVSGLWHADPLAVIPPLCVGQSVTALRDTAVGRAGARGAVMEAYTVCGRPDRSTRFARGGLDGWHPCAVGL